MSAERLWPWLVGVVAVHGLVLVGSWMPAAPVRVSVYHGVEGTSVSLQQAVVPAAERAHPVSPAAPTRPAAETPVSAASPPETPSSQSDAGIPPAKGAETDPNALASYLAGLRQAVAEHKTYPYAARTRRQEGTVLLSFDLDAQGTLRGEPQIVQSSGFARLDTAAVEAVKAAVPFPSPPLNARPWEFRLPVEFVVR